MTDERLKLLKSRSAEGLSLYEKEELFEEIDRLRADLLASLEITVRRLEECEKLRAERDALQRFKDWCHSYLDAKGVPEAPEGPHGAEGCRIGDRMDWVFSAWDKAVADMRERAAQVVEMMQEHPKNVIDYACVEGENETLQYAATAIRALPLTPPAQGPSPAEESSS